MNRKRKPLSQLPLTNHGPTSPKKKRPSASPETLKRAGVITRMILKNFMCHSLLDVDLSVNSINIIIGQNGSGKSAILTALVVGLGGKASLTNRGTSIKGFIKAGRNSGSVEIQLYNGGAMAYRPNIYGKLITVIRHFTAGGSSSYKIKNENGEVVTTQVKEIHNITTSLNIQVDNPVCILNQDTSRNFLNSNDPKHKFTLFMKATKLETLADEYKKVFLNKKESVRIFEDKENNFKKLQNEIKFLKRKIDNHRSIVSIRDKIKLMQIELLWAKVRDAEEEMRKEEENVKKWEDKHCDLVEASSNRAERIQSIKSNINNLNLQLSELKETHQVQTRPQNDIKRIIDELKAKYNEKRKEKHLINSAIESRTKDANILKNDIENATENMERAEREKNRLIKHLAEKNEKMKGMEDHLQTCKNDLFQITSDVNRKETDKDSLRREINRIDQQINNERSSLNALKRESGNTLLLYGREIPQVKQLIEQNKSKFRHAPRGPLGAYIKLKDKKWAVAVESYLTPGLLGSFSVDNVQDNQLLMQIFKSVYSTGRKPNIITSKFFYQKHDVAPNLVRSPSDCVSLYNALEIEDPVVSNCIVDQAAVEGVLLIPSNERAMQLLSSAPHVPKNCAQGVTVKGDKYYPDPNYKTYGSRYRNAQFLQVDTKEHMVQLEQNIQQLLRKKRQVEEQYNAICVDIQNQNIKKHKLEEKIEKLNAARTQIRRQLNELKATAEPEVANMDLLENELKEIQNILQHKTAQLAQIDQELNEIKSQVLRNEEKLKKIKDSNSSLETRMISLEEQIREQETRLKEIATSDEFDKRTIKECQKKLNEARSELVIKQTTVKKYVEQATTLGERQETSRKAQDIVTEITRLEQSVRKIETATEKPEDLLEKYHLMREKFDKVSSILKSLNDDIKELNTAVEKRTRHYKLTENYFITFIKHSFKKIMEMRQFQGSIEISVQEKKLEMIVIPQQGSQGLTTTSNLSGGERSFSTVAFLYSLWQCMEFPFYFLDEFDVYMDKLNRTKVIDVLLHHAESHPELQFVFLTPQDVSFIKKNVSILRLENPERAQV